MGVLKDLPSWGYLSWGLMNGLFLGILIIDKVDISETGIATMILKGLKESLSSAGVSLGFLEIIIFLIGIISIISTIIEAYSIWEKGVVPVLIAFCGFFSLLLLILNFWVTFGVILLMFGALLVKIYPEG